MDIRVLRQSAMSLERKNAIIIAMGLCPHNTLSLSSGRVDNTVGHTLPTTRNISSLLGQYTASISFPQALGHHSTVCGGGQSITRSIIVTEQVPKHTEH